MALVHLTKYLFLYLSQSHRFPFVINGVEGKSHLIMKFNLRSLEFATSGSTDGI